MLSRIYEKFLAMHRIDHVVCFHSVLAYYRVVLEISLKRSIPVLLHNGGPQPNSYAFIDSDNIHKTAGRDPLWEIWKSVPLLTLECQQLKEYFIARESGNDKSINPFYCFKSNDINVRKQLRIPYNSRMLHTKQSFLL